MKTIHARWESKRGAHWVEIYSDPNSPAPCYRGNDSGGCLGIMPIIDAIDTIQKRVDSGYFLPDNSKTPMVRTK